MATADLTQGARWRRLPGVREAAAATTLAGMVVTGFLLAAEVASVPSQFVRWSLQIGYPGWLRGPLDGLAEPITVKGFIGLSILLYVLYLIAVWTADAIRPAWAFAAIAALHLIFLLGPPMYLTDVFNYLGFARLDVLHGLGPYAHHPNAVPGDAVFPYVTWPDIGSPYGPLFTLFSYAAVPLGIAGGVWAYKVTVAIASLGCVALVWALARELERPAVPAIVLVGLNPLLLVYGVGGAHNDVYMLALVLGGVLLAVRGREALGAGAIVAGAAVKATGGLALPFLWLGARQRRAVVRGTLIAAAALLVVSAVAFRGEVLRALAPVGEQASTTNVRSFPGQFSDAFLGRSSVPAGVQAGAVVLFAILAVLAFLHARRDGDWLGGIGWTTLALLLTLTWVMPWYIAWLLPFAALSRQARLRAATLACGAFLLIVHLPYPPN
jgi:Glycosyltransferase family 87